MTAVPHGPLTQAEFPAWEEQQEYKHEFVDGHVYLYGAYGFAGGTQAHSALARELLIKITPAARPCNTFGSDMLIEMAGSTRYADVVVTCDERDRDSASSVVRFPKLIVEVLSESTARDDLGAKMREYQTIDTLQEYVTIDSRKRWAQVFRRERTGWSASDVPIADVLELRSIGLSVELTELYQDAGIAS